MVFASVDGVMELKLRGLAPERAVERMSRIAWPLSFRVFLHLPEAVNVISELLQIPGPNLTVQPSFRVGKGNK